MPIYRQTSDYSVFRVTGTHTISDDENYTILMDKNSVLNYGLSVNELTYVERYGNIGKKIPVKIKYFDPDQKVSTSLIRLQRELAKELDMPEKSCAYFNGMHKIKMWKNKKEEGIALTS